MWGLQGLSDGPGIPAEEEDGQNTALGLDPALKSDLIATDL